MIVDLRIEIPDLDGNLPGDNSDALSSILEGLMRKFDSDHRAWIDPVSYGYRGGDFNESVQVTVETSKELRDRVWRAVVAKHPEWSGKATTSQTDFIIDMIEGRI